MYSPSVEEVELRFLSQHSSRSCTLERYAAYLEARKRVAPYLRSFYEGSFFRSSKYSVYLATKASKEQVRHGRQGDRRVLGQLGRSAERAAERTADAGPGAAALRAPAAAAGPTGHGGMGRGAEGCDIDDVRRHDLQRMQRMVESGSRTARVRAPPAEVHGLRTPLAEGTSCCRG